jgi:hypothetical protein
MFNLNQAPLMTSIGRRRRNNREDNTGKIIPILSYRFKNYLISFNIFL